LVFTVLIVVILMSPLIAEKFRLPDLVMLLAAGVFLGPNGFGMLERDSAVTLFGSVGLLYIMFLAGLEIDLHRFAKTGGRSVIFGILTFVIPQSAGTLAGKYILGFDWPTSILLASMFASHTLLSYPIASSLGISRSEPVAVTVGATIITDTLALLVLAVIADSARGITLGVGFWVGIMLGMSALIIIIWHGIPRLTRWFFGKVTESGGAQFLFVLATVCACSYVSHFGKMEPIIGAFLAGAAFNRLIPAQSILMNRVVFAGNTIFIPFFLISVGMLVNPRALLGSPRSIVVSVTMVVMVILTKYAAAWIAGKIFGYGTDEAKVMFGLSVVQAAATLAAVLVGYDLGIFDETVLNGAIAMIAVTCPLGAWMVDRYGRNLAKHAIHGKVSLDLEQRILVPVANPDSALKILDLAFLLRDSSRPGAIQPITIVSDDGDSEGSVAEGERLLAHCLSHAGSADISVNPSVRVDMNVSDGIVRAAKELRSSLVLVGYFSNRAPLTKAFATTMDNLIGNCPQRILFSRLVEPLNMSRRIIVLMPPMADRRRDFSTLITELKFLSKQIGTEMRVFLSAKDTGNICKRIESARPSRPLSIVECESLLEARSKMIAEIKPEDTVLLALERRSSVLWIPTLDKLAELLANTFPSNNLLFAYPSMGAPGDENTSDTYDGESAELNLCPCDLAADIPLETALRIMTEKAFPDKAKTAEEARIRLISAAGSYPMQMPGESVLLHVHCEELATPYLIIGKGNKSWKIPSIKPDPRIIFALLSPTALPTEQHLKLLGRIGRRFNDVSIVDKVVKASSASEICEIITER
jgi:Kef-type K+ transport system membrane component KefB